MVTIVAPSKDLMYATVCLLDCELRTLRWIHSEIGWRLYCSKCNCELIASAALYKFAKLCKLWTICQLACYYHECCIANYDADLVKHCVVIEVDRTWQSGYLRKIWRDGVREDMKVLDCTDRMHRFRTDKEWKSEGQLANPGLPEKWLLTWCVWAYVWYALCLLSVARSAASKHSHVGVWVDSSARLSSGKRYCQWMDH